MGPQLEPQPMEPAIDREQPTDEEIAGKQEDHVGGEGGNGGTPTTKQRWILLVVVAAAVVAAIAISVSVAVTVTVSSSSSSQESQSNKSSQQQGTTFGAVRTGEPSERPTSSPSFELPSESPSSFVVSSSSSSPSEMPSWSTTPSPSESPSTIPTEEDLLYSYSCPEGHEAPVSVAAGTSVTLRVSNPDTLCLLVLTTTTMTTNNNEGALLQPVARSYHGHDWEPYMLQLGQRVSLEEQGVMVCVALECHMILPKVPPTLQYVLYSPQYNTLSSSSSSPMNEYARFLEQATFGITRQDLTWFQQSQTQQSDDNIDTTIPPIDLMANWILEQQLSIPATLHRVMFRQYANARMESSSDIGQVTHPCQTGSFFRRFAFTEKDKNKRLSIVPVVDGNNTTMAWLQVDGIPITMILQSSIQPTLHESKSYEICNVNGEGVGTEFRIRDDDTNLCVPVIINGARGKPPIYFFPGYEPTTNLVSIPLEQVTQPADVDYFSKYYPQQEPQLLQVIATTTTTTTVEANNTTTTTNNNTTMTLLNQDPTCSNTILGTGMAPILFGRFQNDYFISDPRFQLRENTVENPLEDGGFSVVLETASNTTPDTEALCFNVPRTFVNQDTCRLISSTTSQGAACWSNGLVAASTDAVVVCGSPGEVANDLHGGGRAGRGAFDMATPLGDTSGFPALISQRDTIWATIALQAPDQLRQRVAWALAQLLVVNFSIEGNTRTEDWLVYYDILVRNAFGNYRTVLKEVAFSRMMGTMLTFIGSNSLGSEWISNRGTVKEYPDENFAREILQLFTIGVYELNPDGTHKLDPNTGESIRTYSNENIMDYARAWTGFKAQGYRGNIAQGTNRIDPMTIDERFRDLFPKLGLRDEYVGKGYPLCTDLPNQHFLKKGAKYLIMGSNPLTELGIRYPNVWATRTDLVKFQAEPGGELYVALCSPLDPDDLTSCQFPNVVELPETVVCASMECQVDTIGSVHVSNGIHYEYVQPPCVHQSFYNNPTKIKKRKWFTYTAAFMCADPRGGVAVAGTAFCLDGGNSSAARVQDLFWAERVTFSTAQARGAALTAQDARYGMCTSTGDVATSFGMTQYQATPFLWMSNTTECSIKIKIDFQGKVAIVHSIPDEEPIYPDREWRQTDLNTPSFFRVLWSNKTLVEENLIANCSSPCAPAPDGSCMCDIRVDEAEAFPAPIIPTREEVLLLSVGSFHPDFLGVEYTVSFHPDGVVEYTINATQERIFQVEDDFGRVHLRKNLISTVKIQGMDDLGFADPVQFMSLAEPTLRDALYETDAVLDQLMYHENTAPFIAIHLAQRFGISNPSPRYVLAIANAFRTGFYVYREGSITFGTGTYGDLGAAVAATLLDRETRTSVLDADPAFGSTKETIIKMIAVMRSFEFRTIPEFPFLKFYADLQKTIGQGPYMAPGVFSFFLPEFQPDGPLARAGLVAPEMEIHSGPNMIALVNGLMAMIKYGFDRCHGGFGDTLNWNPNPAYNDCENRVAGEFVNMSGYLSFVPTIVGPGINSSHIIEELATLLTAGRLDKYSRTRIQEVFDNEMDFGYAVIKAQELMVTTPEFHTTGVVQRTERIRPMLAPRSPSATPYKAVVMVFLQGGYDSYNMIVPHAECNGTSPTVDEQYKTIRGSIAMTDTERGLTIDVDPSESQPCNQFAIHHKLSVVKELYDSEELSFFMNMGVLNQPVTRDDYESKTVSQLFAHNHMQREIQVVDPYDQAARTGILGRLTKFLNKNGFNAFSLAINHLSFAVYGDVEDPVNSPPPTVTAERSAQRFNTRPSSEKHDPLPTIRELNGANTVASSLFGETFSDGFIRAIDSNSMLADALDSATLPYPDCPRGSDALNMVVKLMETRNQRGSDRDMFYLQLGGWDHHFELKPRLENEFSMLNQALDCYVQNMRALQLWENVTLVVASDFGRTLTPNSQAGSDHGWGGHYFAIGGAQRKGARRFFGTYPDNLLEDGRLNTGRGRMLPTLSFESMWHPIAQWLGIPSQDIYNVLPNAVRTGTRLFDSTEIFA